MAFKTGLMTTTETDTQNKELLERVLPAFTRQLDDEGTLSLTDRISADSYKGCGHHLLAIHPDNGSIRSICYGTKDDYPSATTSTGDFTEEEQAIFDAFAEKVADQGYTPVFCSFSCWQAGDFQLYFDNEYYNSYFEWVGRANAR